MSRKSSDWYVPPYVIFVLVVPVTTLIAGMLLPLLSDFKTGDLTGFFYSALILGAVGTVILFFARLPLYRKRQFLIFGPAQLDKFHRRLYWVACLFILISVLLMVLIWFRLGQSNLPLR
ncbi:MAG TPA: hypothetical protein VGN23_08680 [Verrucomicrobiae bacterium]|jgi:hypothetical protein